tara:strand:+ start:545 stop:709 length:165 start_codon:yes stop_codon:yes gene_type:complete
MPNIKKIPFTQRKGDEEIVVQPTKSKPAGSITEQADEIEDWGGLHDPEEDNKDE